MVLWRISDGKSTFIGKLWLESRTVVRYSPGSFMTGKFVGGIENIIWPNWHYFKFPCLGMSIKLKSQCF